jgi:sporulation protein YqfC
MKKLKRINNRIEKMLEIPKEIYEDVPKIISIGFEEIIIENYKGILEYEEFFVRINTHIGIININGFNLRLEKMTDEEIKIIGKIENVEIERASG